MRDEFVCDFKSIWCAGAPGEDCGRMDTCDVRLANLWRFCSSDICAILIVNCTQRCTLNKCRQTRTHTAHIGPMGLYLLTHPYNFHNSIESLDSIHIWWYCWHCNGNNSIIAKMIPMIGQDDDAARRMGGTVILEFENKYSRFENKYSHLVMSLDSFERKSQELFNHTYTIRKKYFASFFCWENRLASELRLLYQWELRIHFARPSDNVVGQLDYCFSIFVPHTQTNSRSIADKNGKNTGSRWRQMIYSFMNWS